jgi:hypothetical protein
MIHFTKNTGQFHPSIAYVANIEPTDSRYRGAGLVELKFENGKPVDFQYVNKNLKFDFESETWIGYQDIDGVFHDSDFDGDATPAEFEELFPVIHAAIAGAIQLSVDHGTGTASLLNITGDHA